MARVTKDEILDSLCSPLRKACRAEGLTVRAVVKAVKEGLEAHEVKTSYDKDRKKWFYSKKLIDHPTRLDAANIAVGIFGIKKPDKVIVEKPLLVMDVDGKTKDKV